MGPFAFRTSWVGILILLGVLAALWLAAMAVRDLIVWIREEFFDDVRIDEPKRKRRRKE
jgi:prolipoprotein diacylglyceryltransferase